jgi:radical SAM protein with 4Fe4S-binding SPASM domain
MGGGEPTLYSRFIDLITFIHSQNLIPVVFTNATLITESLADFLYNHNASVITKLDSLRPEIQDYLAGGFGSFRLIQKGLHNLIGAGFTDIGDSSKLRLGINFVCTKLNINETPDIWHFCRKHRIFPNIEALIPAGRALRNLSNMTLSKEDIQNYKETLHKIDRTIYKYYWLPYRPLSGNWLQYLYSFYITIAGDVRPCALTCLEKHPEFKKKSLYPYNIEKQTLKDIYKSDLFNYVRNIDKRLKGKCSECEHLNECIGCRDYAYTVGTTRNTDPYEALSMECQQCFKKTEDTQ